MTEIDVTDKDAATAHVGDTPVVRLAETPPTGFTWVSLRIYQVLGGRAVDYVRETLRRPAPGSST
jgi:hypothetical protein